MRQAMRPEQELFVIGSRLLPEDLAVLLLELRGSQTAEAFDVFAHLVFCLHGVN
jgi:hypothetical protein